MIDINELRRLAQAATPNVERACKYQNEHWIREGHVDFDNADLFIASERPQEDAEFYAAANPAAISELLDRLEAAEKERDWHAERCEDAMNECAALRAKIEQMERQEQARLVTPTAYRWRYRGAIKWQYGELTEEGAKLAKEHNHEVQPLYALPGAKGE